jgi:tRNA (guanine-N7-)-methyltransferase
MNEDARLLLEDNFADETFDAFHLYFPDPWPKVRHRKRRIVQEDFIKLIHRKLKPGGYIHIATDWVDYANWIEKKFAESKLFSGGKIDRPNFRPISKFEGQGIRKGHRVTDLKYFKA